MTYLVRDNFIAILTIVPRIHAKWHKVTMPYKLSTNEFRLDADVHKQVHPRQDVLLRYFCKNVEQEIFTRPR